MCMGKLLLLFHENPSKMHLSSLHTARVIVWCNETYTIITPRILRTSIAECMQNVQFLQKGCPHLL